MRNELSEVLVMATMYFFAVSRDNSLFRANLDRRFSDYDGVQVPLALGNYENMAVMSSFEFYVSPL